MMSSCFHYWGKAEHQGDRFHLLPYHCLDVAAVGFAVLKKIPALKRRMAQLTGMDEEVLVQWLLVLLALHDLGKFLDAFQQLRPDILQRLQNREKISNSGVRHDTLGYFFWREEILPYFRELGILAKKQTRTATPDVAALDAWMCAATGHHGVPHEEQNIRIQDFMHKECDVDAAKEFVREIFSLFGVEDQAFPEVDVDKAKISSWWIAGFIVLCDWLGSSRKAEEFCGQVMPLAKYWDDAVAWADGVVSASGIVPAEVNTHFTIMDLFAGKNLQVSDVTPLQRVSTEQQIGSGPQLFILEDVTGSGKTEAAVVLVSLLMSRGLADGVYFGLPTMATSNGMYRRMSKVYRRLFSPKSNPSCVLAHSARELSEEFRKSMQVREGADSQDYKDGSVPAGAYCSAWLADSRKKALLADIGVGTVDQAVLGVLPSRHQSLRLLGLLGKVLVIDEVHSADSYQNALICDLLKAQAYTGGSAILLSATLAKTQRQGFVNAFAKGLGRVAPELVRTGNRDYPLLTRLDLQELHEQVVETRKSVARSVTVEFLHSEQEVLRLLKETVDLGRCACWIRNTVKDTRNAYNALITNIPADKLGLFHARYALQDRLDIENAVLDRFGPDSNVDTRRGQVLVSSQVTEQSLDLCFDVMVSDLAPIDLLIQRAGRLQRHVRDANGNRIKGEDQRGGAILYVYAPQWSDKPSADWLKSSIPGTAAIYQAHRLWLTQRRMRATGQFRMPEDARSLVEAVYADQVTNELPDGLLLSAQREAGDHSAIASHAKSNALKLAEGYQRAGNWWEADSTPTRYVEKESVTVYLARWQEGRLQPWITEGDFVWARSAVSLMKDLAFSEGDYPEIPAEELARVKETLPGKGRWGILLPLLSIGEGVWYGVVKNKSGHTTRLHYESKQGLIESVESSS